jgi:hypothetical protein
MHVKRFCIALVLICLALPLLAQSKGGWEIVRAEYGSGNNWVDVTDRVRSLVQSDSLNFTVDGATFGAAGRRGRNRTLRLQLKDSHGGSRQMTFRDRQQVDLRIYTAYQSALHIGRATYGSGSRIMDVTARLNQQIQGEQLNVEVNNQSMGGDPAPGRTKTLTLEYTLNGRNGQTSVREGDSLHLPYSNTSDGTLQINRATYGSQYRTVDVTSRLNSRVQGDKLNVVVNSNSMGSDPAPGQNKTLTVQYALHGNTNQVVVNDGDTLRLPYGSAISQGTLRIDRATYGSAYRTEDVTARLGSLVRGDQLNLLVNSYNLGGDPAPNQTKTLTVQYTLNGRSDQIVVNDGDTLRLPNRYTNYGSGNGTQRVRCESASANGNGRTYCPANTRGGIRLIRQLGESACTQNQDWGSDNNNVWVANGCRAEFEVQGSGYIGATSTTTISSGTELSVRTNEMIDSKTASVGQTFSAIIAADVIDNSGSVRIPRGSDAQLIIRSTLSNDLVLDVSSLTVLGTRYLVSTGDLEKQGGQGVGANQKTAIMVGGGAALGTLIGAIAGGGKGAAIGAAVGAGAGLGAEVLTKGKQVRVPAETLLSFKLDQDLLLQAQ